MTTRYEFSIDQATTAGDLHALVDQITHDTELTLEECAVLLGKIDAKFCGWNAEALKDAPKTGRWDSKN